MSRNAVIGLGVGVLAGLVALWFLVIRPTPAPATPASTAPPSTPAPHGSASTTPASRPQLSDEGSAAAPAPTTEGMAVTDHRTHGDGPRTLAAEPGSAAPPAGPRLAPAMVGSIHGTAASLFQGCARQIPKDARGAKPIVGAKLEVEIKDGSLHVLAVTPELRDVTDGPAAEAAKACIHDTLMQFETPVHDEPDIASYPLTLRYVVR